MSGLRSSGFGAVANAERDQPQVVFTRQLWQRDGPDEGDTDATASSARHGRPRRSSTSAPGRITRIDSVLPGLNSSPAIKSPISTADFERLAIIGSPRKRTDELDYFSELLSPLKSDAFLPFCNCLRIPRPRNAFILYRQHYHNLIVRQELSLTNPEISKLVGEKWRSEAQEVKNDWMARAALEKREHAIKYPQYRYKPRRNRKEEASSGIVLCPVCQGRKMGHASTSNTPRVWPGMVVGEDGQGTERRRAKESKRQRIGLDAVSPSAAPLRASPGNIRAGPGNIEADPSNIRATPSSIRVDSSDIRVGSPSSTALSPSPSKVATSDGNAALPSLPPISDLISSPVSAAPVKLAPLHQQPDSARTTDAMQRLQYRIRLFQGTLRTAGRPSPHTRRAPIVAVEGDSGPSSREVADWLGAMLEAAGINVMPCSGPRPPDKRFIVREDLRSTAELWRQRSGDVYRHAVASAPPTTNSTMYPSRTMTTDTGDLDHLGHTSRVHRTARHQSVSASSEAPPADGPADASHTAMIMFRSYVLGASELFAQHLRRLPGAPAEAMLWQYMAEEWRGVIAPDLLIYIKDADDGDEGDTSGVGRFDEGNVLVLHRSMTQAASGKRFAGIGRSAMMRLKLDVEEWLAGFYRVQRARQM